MKKSYKKLFLIVLLMSVSDVMFAGLPPPPPPGLPIDGGISFLVISGLIYGVSKLRKKE